MLTRFNRLFFIFALLIVSGAVSSCFDTYGVREMEKGSADIEAEIELAKNEIAKVKEEIAEFKPKAEKPAAIKAWIAKNIEDKSDSLRQIQTTEKELKTKLTILKACVSSYRIKSSIRSGQSFDSVKLKSGRTLNKVVVKGFDENGLQLMHSGGVGAIPIAELPDELASQISIPPAPVDREAEITAIFAKKPRALMSESEYAAFENSKDERAEAERARSAEKRTSKYEQEKKARLAVSAEKREARVEKEKAYQKMSDEISKYRSAERDLKTKIFEMKQKWKYMNVPPSKSNQESTLSSYDAQLRKIAAAISSLEAKRSAIFK